MIRNEPCNEKVDIWSFGVCLWELLCCEVPYKNVDSSAIIWGVGSNSLQLPIPSTCPDGFKLLIKQCWAPKPRNRPSFKHILMHLDIAAVEILSFKPDDYFRTQQSWKQEVWPTYPYIVSFVYLIFCHIIRIPRGVSSRPLGCDIAVWIHPKLP